MNDSGKRSGSFCPLLRACQLRGRVTLRFADCLGPVPADASRIRAGALNNTIHCRPQTNTRFSEVLFMISSVPGIVFCCPWSESFVPRPKCTTFDHSLLLLGPWTPADLMEDDGDFSISSGALRQASTSSSSSSASTLAMDTSAVGATSSASVHDPDHGAMQRLRAEWGGPLDGMRLPQTTGWVLDPVSGRLTQTEVSNAQCCCDLRRVRLS